MKKFFNYTLKTVLPILLGAFILYMVYDDFDFSLLWKELGAMNLWWFAVTVFFGIMSHVIRGWRWKLTLAPLGYNPSAATCVDSVYVAYAANLVLPRVGEVSRCVILERYEHVPFAHALGTLVMERMIMIPAKIQVKALVSAFGVSAMKTATIMNVDKKTHEAVISAPRIKKKERSDACSLEKRPFA